MSVGSEFVTGLTESPPGAETLVSIFCPIGLRPTREKLPFSLGEIAGRISNELEDIATDLLASATVDDFRAKRQAMFPSYMKLSTALNNIIAAKLDEADLHGLLEDSICNLESEIASTAASYFGDDTCREILFLVATRKSGQRWIPYLRSTGVESDLRQRDDELAREYNLAAIWSDFHLTALMLAVRKNQPLSREILEDLLGGLRLSVAAYTYVRAALDLRNVPGHRYEAETPDTTWDEEDEALADAD